MKKIIVIILIAIFIPLTVYAVSIGMSAPRKFDLGVIRPNKTYDVGRVAIINTDNKYGCAVMNVAYYQNQPEKKVLKEWVIFTPSEFCFEAGDIQMVDIKLYPHKKTRAGSYFSYLEACTYEGSMGACVATKLYFTLNK